MALEIEQDLPNSQSSLPSPPLSPSPLPQPVQELSLVELAEQGCTVYKVKRNGDEVDMERKAGVWRLHCGKCSGWRKLDQFRLKRRLEGSSRVEAWGTCNACQQNNAKHNPEFNPVNNPKVGNPLFAL